MAAVMLVLLFFLRQTLLLQLGQFSSQGSLALHGFDQLGTGQVAPRGGDNGRHGIVLPQQRHGSIQLGLGNRIGAGQDDGRGSFDLIVVELAKVLHIELDLAGVGNRHGIAQGHFLTGHLFHSGDHIGQLAHTRGLNDDTVGMILADDLLQRLTKVAHQAAADAAGVHLRDVDTGFLQETTVDADLTELIFDEYQFLPLIAFRDHFFNQSGLAGTKESRVNINFCHKSTFCTNIFSLL